MFSTEKERLETLRGCRDCAMCHHIDTVAAITGRETNTPRGRSRILWGLEKGLLSWENDGVSDIFYKALLDGLTQEWCDGNYDHDELIIDARRKLVEMGKSPPEVTNVFKNIKDTGNPYGLKERGVNSLVEEAGGSVEGNPEVIIFCGYAARIHRPQVVSSFVNIMRFLRIPFETLNEEPDSGFLFYQLGDFCSATDQARNITAKLEQCKSNRLITLSASDYRMFNTRYPRFGIHFPTRMTVIHITEFLYQLFKEQKIDFRKTIKDRVTYHDPCSLARFTYLTDSPRKLLHQLAGSNFVEMEWHSKKAHCCGGGGGLPFSNPEICEKASRIRIEEALQTGAKILVSSCPECERILSRVVYNNEIEIKDLLELIVDAF